MKKLNIILTLLSLNALLVTIERFSFTTKIILEPYNFLRLHEVFQMIVIILISVILPYFLLKEISSNFETLKTFKGTSLGLIFIVGVYFYATGNGVHEVASFIFNTFCPTKTFSSKLCNSAFFNDYYFGNILYFAGLFLTNISLIMLEKLKPNKNFTKKDIIITLINGFIFAATLFAYAAFDRVLVGLIFTTVAAVIINFLLFSSKTKLSFFPFTIYCSFAYSLAAILSLLVRLH